MRYSDSEWENWLSQPITQDFLASADADIEAAKELLTEEEQGIPHARVRGIIAGLRALLAIIPENVRILK
ncbi:MAG: hypothetical protein RR600_06915 [Aurantimicrobium sp.]|uniref:hypothetical protein n=1 Tax=Aurantimicrobium sp. TaxID=1930784 RepID=UPI0032202016